MPFQIEIKPAGHTFSAESNETVLEAALRNGIAFPYSCRSGTCGSCKGKILSGRIDYIDEPIAISAKEQERGMALFCRARALSDMTIEVKQVSAAKNITVKTTPCRVAKLERLADDVMRLFLKLPQTEQFAYLPGQYVDILLRDGRRRSFSLANLPIPGGMLELHIRRVDDGFFTPQVFTTLQEKALLRIEGPFGAFFLREDSTRPLLFVAGGTGFAPVKAILEAEFAKGATSREIYFYWGGRHRDLLYLDELPQTWARTQPNFHYVPVLSEASAKDAWTGRTGYVHQAVLEDFTDLSRFEVYACGPPAMIDAARESFRQRGLSDDDFFADAFTFSRDFAAE